ncbi:hypothetical protein [Endozoicomonas sp. 8E]|uniref:hypothetical protein n=1 Tax=Endozoicomonas sp. 8E TaxID=3035692 RepID=UPI0029390A90|nr:hypothetical protein [Endozoicomonas sp. 8E]WOG29463.1 hypothetical protein P6910_07385 [Endozoicomonas sp. 8E]
MLTKLNKKSIYLIVLSINLLSGSVFAITEDQKSILKQLTLKEYEELDRELREKQLYVQAEYYIDQVMTAVDRRKRNNFFKRKNRKIARAMGVKASDNTTKFGIPYTLLRTFNLVQAMIHYGKVDSANRKPITNIDKAKLNKRNKAVSTVEEYVDRLLSKRAEQAPITDMDSVHLLFEDRNLNDKITRYIKGAKNKDFDYDSVCPKGHPDYKKHILHLRDEFTDKGLHVLRNGEFILTHVNIIRQGNLQDGDKIIYPYRFKRFKPGAISPKRNSASRAREIYIAVDRLQNFLDKRYPKKFRFSISEKNMFKVSLDFVAPYGWWKDAFFRIEFYFDNIGNEGPAIYVQYAPRVTYLYGDVLCLMQTYKNSKRSSDGPPKMYDGLDQWWWHHCSGRVRYGSVNFSVEEQILNVINFLTADFDIKSEGILSHNTYGESTQDVIAKEIIEVNTQAQDIKTSVYVETDHNKIVKSVRKRIKSGKDPSFDYLIMDDEFDNTEKTESIRTDIFIPVEMHGEAELVGLDSTSIRNFNDLISKTRKCSGFKIPKNVEPTVYYKNEELNEHNFQKVLYDIRSRNTKKKKKERKIKNNILTLIVKVPGYERLAFENAIASSVNYYVPDSPRHLTYNDRHNESEEVKDIAKKGKPIKWEIHLAEKKKLAKANNMLYHYKLILPLEKQKTTERYRGGAQYGSLANVWIPAIRDDMSDVERKFALLSMYDLSRHKFKIPNNLKKDFVLNLGNNIITKALLTPQNDEWLPNQPHLELLLQRVQMALLISQENYSIAKEKNVFFENLISGNIDENVIEDLDFFIGQLAPSLRYLPRISYPDKIEVVVRIILNYLIEVCVRSLTSNEFNVSSEIVRKLIEKPEQFSLEDIYASNKKGISVAFNVLQIVDFLFAKTIFDPFYKEASDFTFHQNELESLQFSIKGMRNIIDVEKNPMPLFLSQLLPTAKYYSGSLDFESNDFLNKFTLSILEKLLSRITNDAIKASLQAFLSKTEKKSDIFSKEKTDELISLFRKNTPELLINVPSGQGCFRQTCYHCGEVYETENPIRGKGRRTNRNTKKPKEPLLRPFHKACMIEDKRIREQAGQLYKKMEKGYPKTQIYEPYYSHHNPVPEGSKLIRINDDGNSMYSSIAEIFNRQGPSEQAGKWTQQTVRQIMDYNLRQIFSIIQGHPDKNKLMQELELLLGIDADVIPAVLDNNVIIDSASFGHSESDILQQFGNAQLIPLLVPTQSVWFPVITQGHDGPYHEIYDLKRWINFAPNLLAMLLQNENFTFPDLSESQRAALLQLLLNQNFDQAKFFVSQILIAFHQSSAYLIHYPGSVALIEHFDVAVSIDTLQKMEVDEAFAALSIDEQNRSMRSDSASSDSSNETDSETLEKHDSILSMIETSFELIKINGDGNCMYSSIAEIFNRNGRSGHAGAWDQQTIRQIMDYNLRQIFSTIQDHPDKEKLMQELELLLGIDAEAIPAVLDNNIITESASFAQSALARLQQFGDAQLIALLVPTEGVWFPVITQGQHGSHHDIYDLKRWVSFTPNLLAILLQDKKYAFPDLSESQRAILLQLLLSQNFDQARLFVSQILTDSHQSSAYLIHSPSSEALLEHFDAAVRVETPRNTVVNSSKTSLNAETFEDLSKDGINKRVRLQAFFRFIQ